MECVHHVGGGGRWEDAKVVPSSPEKRSYYYYNNNNPKGGKHQRPETTRRLLLLLLPLRFSFHPQLLLLPTYSKKYKKRNSLPISFLNKIVAKLLSLFISSHTKKKPQKILFIYFHREKKFNFIKMPTRFKFPS
jgi:hypothetical protein